MASRWEDAYKAFETPEQEVSKFVRRLRSVGADSWNRQSRVVEVCSGRGNGLRAWHGLGFNRVVGVDLSPSLVASYDGPGHCLLGDARALPLASRSVDVVVVQGGLHHLLNDDDVGHALMEMTRIVVPGGRVIVIEPWLTPFLKVVHYACRQQFLRRLSPTLDALATMIDEERDTYERWLGAPAEHLERICHHIRPQILQCRWGKLVVVGSPAER